MRGRRKYQTQKALDAEADWSRNYEVARFGTFTDSAGARLAIEFRELSMLEDWTDAQPGKDRAKFAKTVNLDERLEKALKLLHLKVRENDSRFFEEFAEGMKFAEQLFQTEIGSDGAERWILDSNGGTFADPLAGACISIFMGMSFLKGGSITFAELNTHLEKVLGPLDINHPDEKELRLLCKKIGIPFGSGKRGRKSE